MKISKLHDLVDLAKTRGAKRVAVVAAEDEEVLAAVTEAKKAGIANPILFGNKEQIEKIAKEHNFDISGMTIVDEKTPVAAAKAAVKAVKQKEADVLMKGLVDTSVYLKAILDKENGLTTGGLLSHTALFEIPNYHKKLLFMTDAAINVAPTVEEKAKIIQQCVTVATAIGMEKPKVACVCAVEKVNTKHMPCTVDAAILQAMNKRGQISNCIVEGPFGMDNAISMESCKIKKISGEVAGQADVLLMPDIEAGNVAYKLIMEFANGKLAAIVSGAAAPVVLTSRADNHETKFLSLALAIAVAK